MKIYADTSVFGGVFDKIPKYNAVNILHGFSSIQIYSPLEVIDYEDN